MELSATRDHKERRVNRDHQDLQDRSEVLALRVLLEMQGVQEVQDQMDSLVLPDLADKPVPRVQTASRDQRGH